MFCNGGTGRLKESTVVHLISSRWMGRAVTRHHLRSAAPPFVGRSVTSALNVDLINRKAAKQRDNGIVPGRVL